MLAYHVAALSLLNCKVFQIRLSFNILNCSIRLKLPHYLTTVTCDSCGDPNSFFHCLRTSNTLSVFQCHLRIHLHCSNCICNDACFFTLDTTIQQNIPVLSATLICHLASFRQNSTKQCISASTSMSVTGMESVYTYTYFWDILCRRIVQTYTKQ